MGLNDRLTSIFIGQAVDLMRLEAGAKQKVLGYLLLLTQQLKTRILESNLRSGDSLNDLDRRTRAETVISQSNQTIASAFSQMSRETQLQLAKSAELVVALTAQGINHTLGVSLLNTYVPPGVVSRLMEDFLVQGNPLEKWWAKQELTFTENFAAQIRMGVLGGETGDQLVRRIIGSNTGRKQAVAISDTESVLVPVYEDGIASKLKVIDGVIKVPIYEGGAMGLARRDAESLVLTAVQTVNGRARDDVYKQNSDLISGGYALVTLDTRTSDICKARSRGSWNLITGEPLPDSPVQSPYPGPPPWHVRCRTVIVAILKSWAELAPEFADKLKNLKIDEGTRSSMNGQVPVKVTYEEWLKTKSVADQKEALGEGRYQLWKAGKITFRDLIDQSGRPLTVKELKEKYGV